LIGASQVLILLAVVAFGWYAFAARTILSERVVYLGLAIVGAILALNPELSTHMAQLLGIGRGVDLLFYLFIVFSLFFFVNQAAAARRVELQITRLVRQMAIDTARHGPIPNPENEKEEALDPTARILN
jgi:small membrane protein